MMRPALLESLSIRPGERKKQADGGAIGLRETWSPRAGGTACRASRGEESARKQVFVALASGTVDNERDGATLRALPHRLLYHLAQGGP